MFQTVKLTSNDGECVRVVVDHIDAMIRYQHDTCADGHKIFRTEICFGKSHVMVVETPDEIDALINSLLTATGEQQ